MAILGSSIDPRLQLQDYSGFVNAAQMQAQGLAGLGQQISQAADQYKQYKKEQQEALKRVKAAEVSSSAIAQLVPDLEGPLGIAIEKLRDPNIPLYERDAVAQSIGDVLKLGIAQVNSNALMDLEREKFIEAKQQFADEKTIQEAELQFKQNQAKVDALIKQQNDGMKAAALLAGFQDRMESVGKNVPDDIANSIANLVSQDRGTAALQIVEGYGQSVPDIVKIDTFKSTFRDPITGQPIEATIVNRNGKFVVPEIDFEIPPADNYQPPSVQPGGFQSGLGTPPEITPQGATSLMLPQELQEQGVQNAIDQGGPRTMRVPLAAPAGSGSGRSSVRQETLEMIKEARRLAEAGDRVGSADILNALRFASPFIGGPVTPDNVENVFDLTDNAIAKSAPGAGEQPVKFPLQVRKGNQVATVSNPQELESAKSKGFKPEQ